MNFKVDNLTVARPYAKAAFEYAVGENVLADWSDMLQFLVAVSSDKQAFGVLRDPRLSSVKIGDWLVAIGENVMSSAGQNFIRLLALKKRLGAVLEIAYLFERYRADYEQTVEAQVTSFLPLTEQQQQKISQSLQRRLQRNIVLQCDVDRNLLGGAVIRADDLVIDGSVRGKLNQIEREVTT